MEAGTLPKNMSISEKQAVFAMRTRMTNIPDNYKTSKKLSRCVFREQGVSMIEYFG